MLQRMGVTGEYAFELQDVRPEAISEEMMSTVFRGTTEGTHNNIGVFSRLHPDFVSDSSRNFYDPPNMPPQICLHRAAQHDVGSDYELKLLLPRNGMFHFVCGIHLLPRNGVDSCYMWLKKGVSPSYFVRGSPKKGA